MRLRVHLLGSRDGYRTIAASSELAPEDRRALEVLVFGQSTDALFLSSLAREPAVLVRRLPSGAFALTRLFEGARDDAGRLTLALRSIVSDPADYARLVRADLERVLANDGLWSSARFEAGKSFEVVTPPAAAPMRVGPREISIFDGWLRARERGGTTAGLPDSLESRRAIIAFIRALSPDDLARCQWGLRILSLASELDVATVVPAVERSRRALLSIELGAEPVNPALRFLRESKEGIATLPPSARVLAAGTLDAGSARFGQGGAEVGVGRAGVGADAPSRPFGLGAPGSKERRWLVGGFIAFLVIDLAILLLVLSFILRPGSGGAPGAPTGSSNAPAPTGRGTETPAPADRPLPHAPDPSDPAAPSGAASTPAPPRPTPDPTPAPSPAGEPKNPIAAPAESPPAKAPPGTAPPTAAPPSVTPPGGAPDGPPTPRETLTPAALLERMNAEREHAIMMLERLGDAAARLRAALDGPAPKLPWSDSPTEWSREHCDAVFDAISEFDSALAVQPPIYFKTQLGPLVALRDPKPDLFASRDNFLEVLPALAAALQSIALFEGEDAGNALVTRTGAMNAINRANCDGKRLGALRNATGGLNRDLRPYVGSAPSGRPDLAVASGARTRLQRAIQIGLAKHESTLDPLLVAELKRLAPPTPR